MAKQLITSYTGTTSISSIACAVGDLLLFWAFRDGSTTLPSLPGTLTNIANSGANTCSERLAFKYAASTSESSGTFTNATSVICLVWRNATIGLTVGNSGSSTTFNFAALSLFVRDTTSQAVGFVATRNGTSPASVDTAPSGMTFITSTKDATDAAGAHYTSSNIASWSSQNVATGVAATGWLTRVVEIIDITPPGNKYIGYFNPRNVATMWSIFLQTANTMLSVRFTMPEDFEFDGSTHKIRFRMWANSGTPITAKGVVWIHDAGNTEIVKLVETSTLSVDDTVGALREFILPAGSGSSGNVVHLGMFADGDYNMIFFNPSLVSDLSETQSRETGLTFPTLPSSIDDTDLVPYQVSSMIDITYRTPSSGLIKKTLMLTGVGH